MAVDSRGGDRVPVFARPVSPQLRRGRRGLPLAFHPFEVLGPIVPAAIRPALNLLAFWLILMVIQFPAIYFAGIGAMAAKIAEKGWALAEQRLAVALGLLAGASFAVPWLFASTIANNDLGWRGVLPGMLVLTLFAAAGIAHWLASSARPRGRGARVLDDGYSRRLADNRAECRRPANTVSRDLCRRPGTVGRGPSPHRT